MASWYGLYYYIIDLGKGAFPPVEKTQQQICPRYKHILADRCGSRPTVKDEQNKVSATP
jgi:hypothetical protein